MPRNTHVFDWDDEPVDERPSEFVQSTGYSALSGYHTQTLAPLRSRPASRFGTKSLIAVCVIIVALGAYVLHRVAAMVATT